MTSETIMKNKLTGTTSKLFFNQLVKSKKIGRVSLEEKDVMAVFNTINRFNSMDKDEEVVTGHYFKSQYKVPDYLKDLVLPWVSLNGDVKEPRLIKFEVDKEAEILSPSDFMALTDSIAGVRKGSPDYTSLEDLTNTPAMLTKYMSVLTVDEQYVCETFAKNSYPIKPIFNFLSDSRGYSNTTVETAIENWVIETVRNLDPFSNRKTSNSKDKEQKEER